MIDKQPDLKQEDIKAFDKCPLEPPYKLRAFKDKIVEQAELEAQGVAVTILEYIKKITKNICPHLDHEEIAMDLWCRCWVDRKMPTYTQVKNFCLDKLRKEKVEKKHVGALQFLGNKLAAELPNDILDKLIAKARLNNDEHNAVYRRFYINESANPIWFESATEKLQQAWKEYQDECE